MGRDNRSFGGRSTWWVDLVIGSCLIWLASLGLQAMATATTVHDVDDTHRQLAQTVLQGERDHIALLPYAELQPTEGFVAPSWIHNDDLAPGQIALVTRPGEGDHADGKSLYAVTWKIENIDRSGTIRRVSVSVQWQKSDQRIGRIVHTMLRAGGASV